MMTGSLLNEVMAEIVDWLYVGGWKDSDCVTLVCEWSQLWSRITVTDVPFDLFNTLSQINYVWFSLILGLVVLSKWNSLSSICISDYTLLVMARTADFYQSHRRNHTYIDPQILEPSSWLNAFSLPTTAAKPVGNTTPLPLRFQSTFIHET